MADRLWLTDIRAFRSENNLTQHDLASFLGVSQKTVSRWERGVDQPGPEIRKRLALLLGEGGDNRLPAVYEAVRDAAIPLALIDGQGTVLVASKSYCGKAGDGSAADVAAPPTVLVVEDDDAVLKATRAVLKRWNFLSAGAADAEAAISMLSEGRVQPAAAIIDFLLPGPLDGVDLANALRRRQPHLPVLIISGEATPERMRKISQSGYPFIAKPVDPDEIKMVLLSQLPHNAGESGL